MRKWFVLGGSISGVIVVALALDGPPHVGGVRCVVWKASDGNTCYYFGSPLRGGIGSMCTLAANMTYDYSKGTYAIQCLKPVF